MSAKKYISNNLSAYLNLAIFNNGLNLHLIAKKSDISEKSLNQLLNCNARIKYSETLVKLIVLLQLDSKIIFSRKLEFEKIRNEFFRSIFYGLEERQGLYNHVLEYKEALKYTPYYIDILMIEYVYCISVSEDYDKAQKYISYLSTIIFSLSNYYQKLYYVFLLTYLKNTSQYQEINNVYSILSNIHCNDVNLDGRIYYTSFSIFRGLGNIGKAKQYYFLAKNIFSKMQNHAMLENLNIKYSILLRSIGELKEALRNDVHLLEEYTIKHYRLRNLEILYNNIAWNYSLLHDYRKAVLYYKKALESLQDNDILFNMAYCCYRIGEKSQALRYIEMGKKAPSCGEYIYNLLDWLELVIKAKYCAKTVDILNIILSKYNDDIESNYRTTIQIEIVNYYYYNHMYEEAVHALQPLMGKQLISPSELLFVNKKDKSDEDSVFFDENVDEDLFFDDDWEELEDCITNFTNS